MTENSLERKMIEITTAQLIQTWIRSFKLNISYSESSHIVGSPFICFDNLIMKDSCLNKKEQPVLLSIFGLIILIKSIVTKTSE